MASWVSSLPTARDRVRMLLGDTKVDPVSRALILDVTYDAEIARLGETGATIFLARSLASRFGQEPKQMNLEDGTSFDWGDRVKAWTALADRLQAQVSTEAASVPSTLVVVSTVRRGDDELLTEYYRGGYRTW